MRLGQPRQSTALAATAVVVTIKYLFPKVDHISTEAHRRTFCAKIGTGETPDSLKRVFLRQCFVFRYSGSACVNTGCWTGCDPQTIHTYRLTALLQTGGPTLHFQHNFHDSSFDYWVQVSRGGVCVWPAVNAGHRTKNWLTGKSREDFLLRNDS